MRHVFLQDLFSNFLLAMVVLAVIAMRTQTRDPVQAEIPTPCEPVDPAMSVARIAQQGAVILLTAPTVDTPRGRWEPTLREVRSVTDSHPFPRVLPPASINVLAGGCVVGRFDCDENSTPVPVVDAATVEELVSGCAWRAGADP